MMFEDVFYMFTASKNYFAYPLCMKLDYLNSQQCRRGRDRPFCEKEFHNDWVKIMDFYQLSIPSFFSGSISFFLDHSLKKCTQPYCNKFKLTGQDLSLNLYPVCPKIHPENGLSA